MTESPRDKTVKPIQPLRMLILEDSPQDAKLIAATLRREGYSVQYEITDSPEAFEGRLQTNEYDVILSDYNLRSWNAFDALEILKRSGKDIPLIVVTGSLGDEGAVECIKRGAADYVLKDRPARLAVTVRQALEERKLLEERKEAEEALRESEDRYRDLIENSHDLVCIHDLEGKILSANEPPAKILGCSRDSLLGRSIRDLLPPEQRPGFDEYLARIKKDGFAVGTMLVQTKSGEKRLWEYRNTLRTEGVAKPIVRGMAHDVTERWRAEKALRKSEEQYRLLFENNPQPMWVFDLEALAFLAVNEAAIKHYGYSKEEFLSMTIKDIRPAEDLSALYQNISITKNGIERAGEWRHRKKDGTIIHVEISAHTILFEGRRAELVLANDITERRQAEEALVKLRKAVDNSGEVVFMTDRDGVITFINPEFTRLYGYTEAEVVGQVTPRILRSGTLHPEDYKRFWATLQEKRVARGEITNKKKDAGLVTVESSVSPILDERGTITGFLAIQRDVTTAKQLEEQLRQAQKMEAVGRLAGGIAHDFNNLLTIINGYTQLLQERLDADNSLTGFCDEIRKAGERAGGLTRQLLAFSRRQVLAPAVLDLNHVIANVEKMLRRLIGEHIELRTVPGEGLWHVKADPGQIEQVIMNLAVNARDAMPQGGTLTIETTNAQLDETYAHRHASVAAGEFAVLVVSDTGVGMDSETQARIFEPFFTTKEQGKGTGLGLATVYGIVKQSGGYIWVYSEPGQGATFKIYLPRVEAEVQESPRPKEQNRSSKGTETILLVEDAPGVRELATQVLQAGGYEVLVASDPEQAVHVCEEYKRDIHLLLTDMVMPRWNGRQLADHLLFLRPRLKVLYMSGYTDDTMIHQGVINEGTPFLQKPFTPEGLLRGVRGVLDQ